MPKRTDLKKILVIGSGPVTIEQAAEFDYSGSQACTALLEEGYEVVLVTSNPATITTDPWIANKTYIEPVTVGVMEKIVRRERPDAILPTVGGQTALNVTYFLDRAGVLEKYGIQVLGCGLSAIKTAEDREAFKQAMQEIGLLVSMSGIARSVDQGMALIPEVGLPAVVRPAFTLGGTGSSIIYNMEEAPRLLDRGLKASPIREILVEQSLTGWKELEFEVLQDHAGNITVVAGMENIDPVGIHTGDSAVVLPIQSLSAGEFDRCLDICEQVMRRLNIRGGSTDVQLACNPADGRLSVIEANPRLSRSSCLASTGTGIPIARIATKLALGYTLDELGVFLAGNASVAGRSSSSSVMCKIPRFAFEKFPEAERVINTSMKSVGTAAAVGTTFKEAFQKAIRSVEIERRVNTDGRDSLEPINEAQTVQKLATPNDERFLYIRQAMRLGFSIDRIHELTGIDRWFLSNFKELADLEEELKIVEGLDHLDAPRMRRAKAWGFSDRQIAQFTGSNEWDVRRRREELGITPAYLRVGAQSQEPAEFQSCLYSTYGSTGDSPAAPTNGILIIGAGPNPIGRGIEFDHSCVQAAVAARGDGYQAIMFNCSPVTVGADCAHFDRVYLEPVTPEDVLNLIAAVKPSSVILQFSGRTSTDLQTAIEAIGTRVLGTSRINIERTDDRTQLAAMLDQLGMKRARGEVVTSHEEARKASAAIGYPVSITTTKPIGGAATRVARIAFDERGLQPLMTGALAPSPEQPVMISELLEDAVGVDVDAISDGHVCIIGAVMEHIERAGIHSGDSACVIPPQTLPGKVCAEIVQLTKTLSQALNVVGLINVQFGVQGGNVYVLGVNPRASRTIPFVSKATGIPLAHIAAKVLLGHTLEELGFTSEIAIAHVSVKEAVFPFARFPGIDTQLGAEMKSTGEAMGIADNFGMAFAKAQISAGQDLPADGVVFVSLMDKDKVPAAASAARTLAGLGFQLVATEGTANFLRECGLGCRRINKIREGRPHIVDKIIDGEVALVINTPSGKHPQLDGIAIRSTSWARGVPIVTTLQGAVATAEALKQMKKEEMTVRTLQEFMIDTFGRVPSPKLH